MLRATASPEWLARDCCLNSEWRSAEAQEAWGDFAVPHRKAKPLVARLGRVPARAR
jgi:hypothetical protein